jgi:signal peptidase I
MTMPAFLSRLYALATYLYPPDFRGEYGRELKGAFSDCASRTENSLRGWLRFFTIQSADLLRSVLREHFQATVHAQGPIFSWGLTILCYIFVSGTIVQAYVIPTGSMESSLRIGDHLFVDKIAYSGPGRLFEYREIHRGDILAFRYPVDPSQTFVKRVIGLPGDRIRLEKKQVIRNGRPLNEPYVQHIDAGENSYRDNFPAGAPDMILPKAEDMLRDMVNGEVVVPQDRLFMLGDNRDNSLDSRYWGFVPRENVVGRPLFVYWSYDGSTGDWVTWNLDHFADLALHFFSKTRWERTFYVPHSEDAK